MPAEQARVHPLVQTLIDLTAGAAGEPWGRGQQLGVALMESSTSQSWLLLEAGVLGLACWGCSCRGNPPLGGGGEWR